MKLKSWHTWHTKHASHPITTILYISYTHYLHTSRYTLVQATQQTHAFHQWIALCFLHIRTHTHYSAYKKYSKACSTYTTSYIAYTAIIRHGANTQYNTKHYNAKQNSTVQNKNNKLFTHTKNIYIDTSATCMMLDKVALPCLILRCLCYITCIGASPCIYFLLCLVISKVNIYIYNERICANMCVINHVAACVTYGDICMKRTSSTQ